MVALKPTTTLLQYLGDEWDRMDADYKARSKAFVKHFKQFRGVLDSMVAGSTKSHLFLNRTKVACIAGVANVLDVLIPSEDFFEVVGRNAPDVKGSEMTKQATAWSLRVGDFFNEVIRYILQAAIIGTTFAKIVPKEVTEKILVKEPTMLGEGIQIQDTIKTGEKLETVQYAQIETVDVHDIRVDPLGLDVDRDQSSGLFHLFTRRLGYLRMQEKAGLYYDVDEIAALIEKSRSKKDVPGSDRRRQAIGLPQADVPAATVYLKEYWGVVPADIAKANRIEVKKGEEEVESLITIAGLDKEKLGTVIIRAERNTQPNQMRMFVRDVWEPSGERSMWGRGIPENVRGSQQALNVTVNLRLDNQAWAIAAPLVVNMDKIENPSDLVARVNWVIRGHGGSPGDIAQFVQVPNITGSAIPEAQEFERHISDESGMNQQVQATQSFGSNRTFGGISLAYSAAARPVRLIARGFESNLISKGLKKLFISLAARLSDVMKVRITDDPTAPRYLELDPLKLALDVDFLASGSFALLQREQLTQNILGFFDFVSKVPSLAQRAEWQWKTIAQDYYQAAGLHGFDRWWKEGAMGTAPMAGGPGGGNPLDLAKLLGAPGGAPAGGATPVAGPGSGGPNETQPIPGAGGAPGIEGDGRVQLLAALGRMAKQGAGSA
jgi:hypothetical protein